MNTKRYRDTFDEVRAPEGLTTEVLNMTVNSKTGVHSGGAARRIFVLAAVFLTLFIGVLIPSAYVASSPQEFVDVTYFFDPIWYVVNTGVMAAGFFLLWFGVFYWLASPRGKRIFERIMWVLSGIAVADYMFFGTKLGILSSALKYEGGMIFSRYDRILNPIVLIVLGVVMVLAAITCHVLSLIGGITNSFLAVMVGVYDLIDGELSSSFSTASLNVMPRTLIR